MLKNKKLHMSRDRKRNDKNIEEEFLQEVEFGKGKERLSLQET